jgi:hypothetical protein
MACYEHGVAITHPEGMQRGEHYFIRNHNLPISPAIEALDSSDGGWSPRIPIMLPSNCMRVGLGEELCWRTASLVIGEGGGRGEREG